MVGVWFLLQTWPILYKHPKPAVPTQMYDVMSPTSDATQRPAPVLVRILMIRTFIIPKNESDKYI